MKILTLMISLFSFFVSASPEIKEQTSHYKIQPEKINQLLNSIKNHGNVIAADNLFHGGTNWQIKWTFNTYMERSKCRLKKVKTKITMKYKLPQIEQEFETEEFQSAWDEYYKALIIHQNGHKDVAYQTAEEIERAIKSVKKQKTCDRVNELAHANAQEILAGAERYHQLYDNKTNMGEQQGVNFYLYVK